MNFGTNFLFPPDGDHPRANARPLGQGSMRPVLFVVFRTLTNHGIDTSSAGVIPTARRVGWYGRRAMQIGREMRVRMERAHVLAWPALSTARIDGWLWRYSGGGSQRANSVSTVDYSGSDIVMAVREVEARYMARGAPARFHSYDETSPPGLAEMLEARGYREGEATATMFKHIERGGLAVDVEHRDRPSAEWLEVYLGEISENRRAVNALVLDRIPAPRAFFGCRRDGRIVSTALGVVGYGCAVIECVTTRAADRRRGAAFAVLTALESWAARQRADTMGLQVVTVNTAAVALYRRLGFVAGATNRFWIAR
jgi:ribosomal protein S18 acetylase RimI-like enzyme